MSLAPISEFTQKVMQQIYLIPAGKVATYKQIAELAGKPQASRGVSWILHSCSTIYKLPWHRVLNSQGKISFDRTTHNYRKQKSLLKKEGVVFDGEQLNMAKYQWKKKSKISSLKSAPKIFSCSFEKKQIK